MKKTLAFIVIAFFVTVVVVLSCTKNSNPQPPIHDTVTVNTTDTLYATKPDPTVNLTKGLLLYLPFSGNIADSSGNANPTSASGGTVLTYDAHGYANSAFGATGAGQKIYVTNNGSIKFDTAYSISFGFMVNSTGLQTYMSMVDPVTGHGPSFIIGTTLPGVQSIDMGTNDISSDCGVDGTNNSTNIADTTGFVPQLGAWYNAIGIYHKGSVQFYINGVLVGSKTGNGTASLLCPASQIVIGAWWNSDPQGFNGKLDNIRLYNRVLTPHEIVALSSSYQITSNRQRPSLQTH
jgi:hypothetical protein